MLSIIDPDPRLVQYNGISVHYGENGYSCLSCGQWVPTGTAHTWPAMPGTIAGWQCPRCGQFVTSGGGHVCISPLTVGTFYPPAADICNHCYCIDVPPSGKRTKPHAECCLCGSIHVAK